MKSVKPSEKARLQEGLTKDEARPAYRPDLAYIHDSGFGHLAKAASGVVLEELGKLNGQPAVCVDLGCGSGILAHSLVAAGHHVVGFDLSAEMLRIARRRAPMAEFRRQSFVGATLPACTVVTAIGEIFSYLFDKKNTTSRLQTLFMQIYKALAPGGFLLFDIASPGRAGHVAARQRFMEGPDWVCVVEVDEDADRHLLTRRIVSFRKVGAAYRRDDETHRLRLYRPSDVVKWLRRAGFRVRRLSAYGDLPFPAGLNGFLACKPIVRA